jgi:hypothetical protein
MKKRGKFVMRKWPTVLLALLALAMFPIGCAGITHEKKVKCPKCGPDVEMQKAIR